MNTFKKDLYRYYGREKETISERIKRPMQIKFLACFRKAQSAGNSISRAYYKMKLRRLSKITHIQIPWCTDIGEGLCIDHCGKIIVNPKVKMGKNINIASGVVIGQENRGERKGVPTIGNKVWIGANSVIVGNITIGDNVLIAPLTYVNFNVPSNTIVVGNPGKCIEQENATESYINRTV